MAIDENKLVKKISDLEEMNKKMSETIKNLTGFINQLFNENKQNNLAIQIMACELKIDTNLREKMNARGYHFEFEPFL